MTNKELRLLKKKLKELNKDKIKICNQINEIQEELQLKEMEKLKKSLKGTRWIARLSEEDLNIILECELEKIPKVSKFFTDDNYYLLSEGVELSSSDYPDTIYIGSNSLKELYKVIREYELEVDDSELIKDIDKIYDELEEIENLFIY